MLKNFFNMSGCTLLGISLVLGAIVAFFIFIILADPTFAETTGVPLGQSILIMLICCGIPALVPAGAAAVSWFMGWLAKDR
jgi:hypothetical protein